MTNHFHEAERLLAESRTILRPHDEGHCEADRLIAEAQVHATLATAPAGEGVDPDQHNEVVAELAAARKRITALEKESSRLVAVECLVERGHRKGYTPDIEELAEALGLTEGGADRG